MQRQKVCRVMRRSWLANQTSKQTKNPAPRAGKHWFECVYMYPSTAVLFVLFAALRYLKLIVAPSSVSSVMGGSCGCVDSRNALDEGSSTRIAVLGTPAKGEFKWLIDRSIDPSLAPSLAPSLHRLPFSSTGNVKSVVTPRDASSNGKLSSLSKIVAMPSLTTSTGGGGEGAKTGRRGRSQVKGSWREHDSWTRGRRRRRRRRRR